MRRTAVRNETKGRVVGSRIDVADSFFARLVGLMGRRHLDDGEGLLLERTPSIHTFFMRIPIDVVYLDREGTVLETARAMRPQRLGPVVRSCAHVLELPAGRLDEVPCDRGDRLSW